MNKPLTTEENPQSSLQLETYFQELATIQVAREGVKEDSLVSQEQQKEHMVCELKNSYLRFEEELTIGVRLISQEVRFANLLPSPEKIAALAGTIPLDGKTEQPLSELFGISIDSIFEMYDFGEEMLERSDYEEGGAVFVLLSLLFPIIPAVWVALGKCKAALHNYDDAAFAYTMAVEMDEKNPLPAIHAASCLREAGKPEEARNFLQHVIKESQTKNVSSEMVKYMKEALLEF